MSDKDAWKRLGDRARNAPAWEWLPGMLDMDDHRFIRWSDGAVFMLTDEHEVEDFHGTALAEPDFRDPATVGCLRELVGRAFDGRVWVKWWFSMGMGGDESWCEVVDARGRPVLTGKRLHRESEVEALVDALEAAP